MKSVINISWISIMQITILMEITATPFKRTTVDINGHLEGVEYRTTDDRYTKTAKEIQNRRVPPTSEADKQTSSASRDELDMGILFPGDETQFLPVASTIEPKCAKGSTFCENIDEYPAIHVDILLRNGAQKYDELFGEDVVMPNNLMNRYNGGNEEESLCTSVERVIYPKMAEKLDNTWAYIINQPNYTQGVRIEQCVNVNNKCHMTHSFPHAYDTKCKQKFIYRQLLALDKNGRAEKTLFRLPSCCECVLIRGHIGRHGQ